MSHPPYADILDLINIAPVGDEAAVAAVRARDATLTKPPGSLGALEGLVEHLARWQGKAEPTLDNPMVAVFAGNHGVTDQGVSAFPREVTAQMVANFTDGGAAISQICALHGLNLRVFELALELPTGDITHRPGDGRSRLRRDGRLRHGGDGRAARTCSASARWGSATPRSPPRSMPRSSAAPAPTGSAAAPASTMPGSRARPPRSIAALALHRDALGDPLAVLARLGGREIAGDARRAARGAASAAVR